MIKRIIGIAAAGGIVLGVLGAAAAHAADGDSTRWAVAGDPSQWG